MAASLLHAAGLPELVTTSLEDYERAALALSHDRAAIDGLKARLAQYRASCALFATTRFRNHLEAAYRAMWERHQAGAPAASLAV
jgi:predicted O-linked N-acetylglucosamine transferase (SPINDLY family)